MTFLIVGFATFATALKYSFIASNAIIDNAVNDEIKKLAGYDSSGKYDYDSTAGGVVIRLFEIYT